MIIIQRHVLFVAVAALFWAVAAQAEPAVPPLPVIESTRAAAAPEFASSATMNPVQKAVHVGHRTVRAPQISTPHTEAHTATRVDLLKSVLPSQGDEPRTAEVVRIALILTLMAILPAVLLSMTSFVRIIVVLSMIRHGLGMPETPPNQVLLSLAIFLTIFSMMPTLTSVNESALRPFLEGRLTIAEAIDRGDAPVRTFMLKQVRDQDIEAVYRMAHKPLPSSARQIELMQLVPAFLLNELRVSFRIGFVILLPFLMIDLVVSSILLSLGMLMVPPTTLSLPIKVLMFVLIDGWSLVVQGVLGSFL